MGYHVGTRALDSMLTVGSISGETRSIDTSTYSFAYVARWSDGFTELVKDTAERVVGCAKQILEDLEVAAENDSDMEKAS